MSRLTMGHVIFDSGSVSARFGKVVLGAVGEPSIYQHELQHDTENFKEHSPNLGIDRAILLFESQAHRLMVVRSVVKRARSSGLNLHHMQA